ncbi:MAG: DNA polymerase III subunit delta' C-terminal domain-containing protein, partial [Candidatus Hinthialibacter sp.]
IRSRCWKIRLLPLEISDLAQSLQPELPAEQAVAIARAAGGLPGQAKQLMENDYLDRRDQILDWLLQIKERESAVVESAESLVKNSGGLVENLLILLRIVRDGFVAASQGDPSQFENQDRIQDLSFLWKDASIDKLISSTKNILAAMEDQERFVNPSILVMDLLIQLRESMKG